MSRVPKVHRRPAPVRALGRRDAPVVQTPPKESQQSRGIPQSGTKGDGGLG